MPDGSPVSVIIPVYNGERYLAEAVESALAQTHRPLEIIVVDDGSTDGSADVARSFPSPVRCHTQGHGGISAARNRGVESSRGCLLAFLDADDLWLEEKLEFQVAAFEADPELGMAFGHVRQFLSPDLDESVAARIHCPAEIMPAYLASATLVRRDAFHRVGAFDVDRQTGEFIDWYARAAEAGIKERVLPEVVLRRRLHAANAGVLMRHRERIDYLHILKASLDRRRESSADGPSFP